MTRIDRIEIYPLTIPYREVARLSYGFEAETKNVFIKIFDEDGVVGVGEACAIVAGQENVLEDVSKIGPKLIGSDCFDIGPIYDIMKPLARKSPSMCGIDMALYDLMGKLTGQPVYNLIGGCYRKEIPTQHVLWVKDPEEMAADALKYYDEGYRIFEIKLAGEPELDIERTRAIREAVGPEVEMIMDPGSGWTVEDSIKCLREMEELDIFCEEPTEGIDAIAQVRREVNVPIVVDQSSKTPEKVIEVVAKEAGDAVNIKIQSAGGIYPARKTTSICDAAGLKYRIDDSAATRVANTASAHFAAASKNIFGCGVAQHTFLDADLIDLICEGGVRIERGIGIVPSAPGLGVTLNDELFQEPLMVFS